MLIWRLSHPVKSEIFGEYIHMCVCVCVVWVGWWAAAWEGDDWCVWVGGEAGGEGSLNNNGLSESLE